MREELELEFLYRVADLVAAAKHLGLDEMAELLQDMVTGDWAYNTDAWTGYEVRQAATRERLATTGMLA